MTLPQHYLSELQRFEHFSKRELTPTERQVLRLLAVDGLAHKEIALKLSITSKSVERTVNRVVTKYREFYAPAERQVPNRRVINRAAWYYGTKELLMPCDVS